jgi:hypothetical protein
MGLPYDTTDSLAEKWRAHGVTIKMIRSYIKTGDLAAEWVESQPARYAYNSLTGKNRQIFPAQGFLKILPEEVERFEVAHFTPDTSTAPETTTEADPARYLDLKREDLPEELKAAIEAWLYVKQLDTDPAIFKKELVRILGGINYGYKGKTLDRIATVANPYKDAGTPRRNE